MSNKLHPIYVALDNHQYSRAVKLASSLPQSNHLGQALLAHAHLKSGHAVKSLLVIQSILWFHAPELMYEIERLGGAGETATSDTPKHKKGSKQKPEIPSLTTVQQRDLLEQLDSPFILKEGWDQVKVDEKKLVITDETTLDMLQVTLQSIRLYATVYQMYASASAVAGTTPHILTKAYLSGLRLVPKTLGSMQVFALQLARLRPETTLWAARTALWQLEWSTTEQQQQCLEDAKKQQMLPRLAESLAGKSTSESAEASLLYISTLQYQKKWQQVVDVLQVENQQQQQLTLQQKGEVEAHAYEQLQQWDSAQRVYQTLLQEYPEQWAYWKKVVQCAHHHGGWEGASKALGEVLQQVELPENSHRPCRSRHLIMCELATIRIRHAKETTTTTKEEALSDLQNAIIQYGSVFCARTSCAYSDLAPYIEILVELAAAAHAELSYSCDYSSLLEWANQLLKEKGDMDHSWLRKYIFAIQVTYKVLAGLNDNNLNQQWLPDWTELVKEWRASQKLGTSKEGEGVQKESQPGDELILLAVQNLLFRESSTCNLLSAASLLEEALLFSPYNASLRITAMDIYSRLNAVHRAYELYQGLTIKHIQLDSCSYLILSRLIDGGLYNEALDLCTYTLKFHASIARETGEFAASAMEHGTLSKAHEFLIFFRRKMEPSLSLLDAKGRIMDCAPLLYNTSHEKHSLGLQHGIVGGESDLERVDRIVREAHNPFGAPSSITTLFVDSHAVSDNRDFSILSHQILIKSTYATKKELVNDFIRRGLLHGLLVRLTLCMDAIKGPKKGKAPTPSERLRTQCTSLLNAVHRIGQFIESGTHEHGYSEFMEAIRTLCRTIVVVSAGHVNDDNDGRSKEDSLSNREEYATMQLESIVMPKITTWLMIPTVCRFLPDMLVPFMAVFRKTANLFALFGWGKRKCRPSVIALAKLAVAVKEMVGAMRTEISRLPESDEECRSKADELLGLVDESTQLYLDDSITRSVCQSVSTCQQLTQHRVVPFLDEILDELSSFQAA